MGTVTVRPRDYLGSPTSIDGIALEDEVGVKEGHYYSVRFTLYVDAATSEEADTRAMRVRDALVNENLESCDFYWHLHDHTGC